MKIKKSALYNTYHFCKCKSLKLNDSVIEWFILIYHSKVVIL